MYLVVIMDWYSRYVLAWLLSNTLDADYRVEELEEALKKGKPDIFNTDHGSQFTGKAFRIFEDVRHQNQQYIGCFAGFDGCIRHGIMEV